MRALLVFATLTLAASAAHAAPIVTLTTVDEFERLNGDAFSIPGIPGGQSTAQTAQYRAPVDSGSSYASSAADACERAALMMMNRPGRWQLQINPGNTCRFIKQ